MEMAEIKGIIYDLDGTLVSTVKLHELAWQAAGKEFDVPISKKMLLDQKGMSDEAAALMMLPKEKRGLVLQFVEAKQNYVRNNLDKISLFPGALENINNLLNKGYQVWICTSSHNFFVKKVFNLFPGLGKALKENVVCREMYERAKPYPDALDMTIKRMGLNNSQVYYVGDAFKDYEACLNAKVKFIYFCPNIRNWDERIPKYALTIRNHREIFKNPLAFLKENC